MSSDNVPVIRLHETKPPIMQWHPAPELSIYVGNGSMFIAINPNRDEASVTSVRVHPNLTLHYDEQGRIVGLDIPEISVLRDLLTILAGKQ